MAVKKIQMAPKIETETENTSSLRSPVLVLMCTSLNGK